MSKAFEEIAKEVTQLSPQQRLKLASLLLKLNEDPATAETSAEWEEEILARIRAVDENEVDGVSFESVLLEAEGRLAT
jgi:predicted GTPase